MSFKSDVSIFLFEHSRLSISFPYDTIVMKKTIQLKISNRPLRTADSRAASTAVNKKQQKTF